MCVFLSETHRKGQNHKKVYKQQVSHKNIEMSFKQINLNLLRLDLFYQNIVNSFIFFA